MNKIILANTSGIPLNVQTGVDGSQCLVTDGSRVLAAHWRSETITTNTTTTIIEARPDEAVMITDLIIILSKKVASATIISRFYDGTNAENFFTFDAATASFQFSHAFQGGIKGWKEANFQIVTNQSTTVSVFVGYVHINTKQTSAYDVWNSAR